MHAARPVATGSDGMVGFWRTLHQFPEEPKAASTFSSVSPEVATSVESSLRAVHWIIENRGGFAFLAGLAMVPSQFRANAEASQAILAEAKKNVKMESFRLGINEDAFIEGIILYPPHYDVKDRSRAILYHSPNGAVIADFFVDGRLDWTPGLLAATKGLPIILYDYRGTGLSKDNPMTSSLAFRPTYASVVVDGTAMQRFALERFDNVEVWGSSLGGAVGTNALANHLELNPTHAVRVTWTNHDSLTTTSRVVLPSLGWAADWIGWPLGGLLDAQTAMRRLIERGVRVTVLCHRRDPVIPAGARMAEFVEAYRARSNVRIIYSERYGHADLSEDMLRALEREGR